MAVKEKPLNKGRRQSDAWIFPSWQYHVGKALGQGPIWIRTSPSPSENIHSPRQGEGQTSEETQQHCTAGEARKVASGLSGKETKESQLPRTQETEKTEDVNTDEVMVKRRGGGRREGSAQKQIPTSGQDTDPGHMRSV